MLFQTDWIHLKNLCYVLCFRFASALWVRYAKDGTWFEKIRATGILHCVLFVKFDFHFPYRFNWIVSYLCKKVFCAIIVTDSFSFLCYIFVKVYFVIYEYDMKRLQVVYFWICMLHNQCQTGDMHKETWIIHSIFELGQMLTLTTVYLTFESLFYLSNDVNLLFNMHLLHCHLIRGNVF